eukprot:1149562-Pelagomonas_calceolata.AAC.3
MGGVGDWPKGGGGAVAWREHVNMTKNMTATKWVESTRVDCTCFGVQRLVRNQPIDDPSAFWGQKPLHG